MIDVLMIALQFAPVQSTGAFRSIEFARRLSALGIRPTVITIHPDQAARIFGGKVNPDLSEGLVGVDIRYIREDQLLTDESPLRQLWRMLTTLNDTFERRFAPDLARVLARLKTERSFAAVYASAPPFGATGLGATAARVLGAPYILDMRDAWAQWSPAPQITRLHYARKFRDEAQAFAAADAIVGVTRELTNLFAKTHAGLPTDKLHVIPNGIGGVEAFPDHAAWYDTGDTVDIGYVGSFYYTPPKPASLKAPHRFLHYEPGTEDWSYRSPLYFFKAWQALEQRAPDFAQRMRFHHVGHTPDWLPNMAATYCLEDKCIFHGPLPRQEMPVFLKDMSGLLATSMKRFGGRDYCLASKSFEYLASGKPIIAFVCEGAQKSFFERVGGALVFDPEDAHGSAQKLQALAGQGLMLPINKEHLQAYDLDRNAEQLAALLKKTADRQSAL
uniref:glycosyltransferase n=1 Tax=Pararhizobium sp. IMCC3301 TaxID=3067904 RepID=UPI0027415724|nr:glycosyltransferase [Pararhizobium sp. IMCC3301]